jgi:hypothetical protein
MHGTGIKIKKDKPYIRYNSEIYVKKSSRRRSFMHHSTVLGTGHPLKASSSSFINDKNSFVPYVSANSVATACCVETH